MIESLIKVSINWLIFRRLTKKFDQLIRSSEIRSTDHFPLTARTILKNDKIFNCCFLLCYVSTENLLFVVDVQVVGGRLWKNDSWQDKVSGCVFALSRGFAVGNIFWVALFHTFIVTKLNQFFFQRQTINRQCCY